MEPGKDQREVFEAEVVEGPKPTGRMAEIQLTGCLMPWRNGQPAMLRVPGSPFYYVPVFSEQGRLQAVMSRAETPYDDIKQITDESDFMTSFPSDVKVMFNPYFTDEGRVRWSEIKQD